MMERKRRKRNNQLYAYKKVLDGYSLFKNKEIKTEIPDIDDNSIIIVRLDGKGLTKKFKSDELYNETFLSAMEYVHKEISKYCPVIFTYGTSDEISLLFDLNYIKSKEIEGRLEKLLTYLSGYVSSLFTIAMQCERKEAYSFDARAIILDRNEIKEYFIKRQSFSIWRFIEKLCHKYNFDGHRFTIHDIDILLKGKGESWRNFSNKVKYGFVGYYNQNKWEVEESKDFCINWPFYFRKINTYTFDN